MTATPTLHLASALVVNERGPQVEVQGDSFLLDLAHELRSPLSAFTVALEELGEDDETLDRRDRARLLRALRRSTLHLQSIVDNLRDVATMGTHAFTITPVEIDLEAVVREAVQIVEPLLDPRGQTIVVDLPPDTPLVLADPLRIRQVLVNLLHNAIRYGSRHEAITVRARVDTMAVVEVGDLGEGIPPEEQGRLFEPHVRGRAGLRAGSGSGMGLAIARAITRAHGGSIGVHSACGEGSTFWFTLHLA